MTRTLTIGLTLLVLVIFQVGCETAPEGEGGRALLEQDCEAAIALFKQTDETMQKEFFNTAHGYAVFPKIAKGGLVVGGAGGRGQVYEQGKVIGYATLSQGSIGAQIGGQSYQEIIFFQTEAALASFTGGTFELAAQASGVAASAGGAATADYAKGVAVFTLPLGGLMGEASVGGQQFDYESLQDALARD